MRPTKRLDFTSAADLALIKTEAASKAAALDGVDAATMTALADDTTDAIKRAVNDKIATVADLDADRDKRYLLHNARSPRPGQAAEDQKAGK